MLNFDGYRRRETSLTDYLPWAVMAAPGVILNKDGSFQRSYRYRGPDLESATEAELLAISARLNTILKRFGSGWALFFDAERIPARDYPAGQFDDAASWLVDEERRSQFETAAAHYESRYVLTFLYLPPPEIADRAGGVFFEKPPHEKSNHEPRAHLRHFLTETDRAAELMSTILPECAALDDSATLTYLHSTVSARRHRVDLPDLPVQLDALMCDTPLAGGVAPRLGDHHLRVLSMLGFPGTTMPGILDSLNDLGFAYRWMTRWIALEKQAATKGLTRLRRQWFAKRKSVAAVLREVMFNRETALVDSDAENKTVDADAALQELGADDVAFGHLTMTLIVSDPDPASADEKLLALERILNARGFVTIRESLNAVEAWLGSLPGHAYANVRQPIVHTLNLVHLMPVSAVWAGPRHNAHLAAPPLMVTETRGSTPFRLDLHIGDVGHTLIVGPTGSGKSVLLAMLALQFRRFIGAQIFSFDKGRSLKASLLAMGGTAFDLGLDQGFAFQPLSAIDRPAGIAFARDWVLDLLSQEGADMTPETKDAVWSALQSLASARPEERTLTGLAILIQSNQLSQALTPYTLEGAYGRLLDAAEDKLTLADVMHFELDGLMQTKAVIVPVLTYLFHRLEARFGAAVKDAEGTRPSLLILDEAWAFLDNPLFAARIREWLKVLRKKNVAVVFATQSLADIEGSTIAPALLESCPTRIFLPNDRAIEPQAASIYQRFGLNHRQIGLLAAATPKRDYYVQTARGNRLFSLGLGPIALALAGSSSGDEQRLIDRLIEDHPEEAFAPAFLRAKGLNWAADLIAPQAGPAAPPTEQAAQTDEQEASPAQSDRFMAALDRELNGSASPSALASSEAQIAERFSPYRIPRKKHQGATR